MMHLSVLSTKLYAIEINCGIGIAGFALSMVWRRSIGSMFEREPVGLLAKGWLAITACGLALALVT
jgi:predicted ATP-grasp superfamily ATP-dependent carboligase